MNIAYNHKPARVKRRNRSEWEQLIRAYHQNGLSSKQFCIEHGLGYASFCQWKRRLSSELELPGSKSVSPFIDIGALSSMSHGAAESSSSSASWQIVLKLGNGVELCLNQVHVPS